MEKYFEDLSWKKKTSKAVSPILIQAHYGYHYRYLHPHSIPTLHLRAKHTYIWPAVRCMAGILRYAVKHKTANQSNKKIWCKFTNINKNLFPWKQFPLLVLRVLFRSLLSESNAYKLKFFVWNIMDCNVIHLYPRVRAKCTLTHADVLNYTCSARVLYIYI